MRDLVDSPKLCKEGCRGMTTHGICLPCRREIEESSRTFSANRKKQLSQIPRKPAHPSWLQPKNA